jgi:SAM-dependent methyltransferase
MTECPSARQTLESLLADERRVAGLLEGSLHYGGTFATWTDARRFITRAIHHSGTILDIGCANGFLLRCLQEWSPYRLSPYGIDQDATRLGGASTLFRGAARRFANVGVDRLQSLARLGLPHTFDFVYWNVWKKTYFDTPNELACLASAAGAVRRRGRLILGFYDVSSESRETKIENLVALGFDIAGRIGNDSCNKEAVWIER